LVLASPFPVGAKLLQMNQPPCIDQIVSSSWQPALMVSIQWALHARHRSRENALVDARDNEKRMMMP